MRVKGTSTSNALPSLLLAIAAVAVALHFPVFAAAQSAPGSVEGYKVVIKQMRFQPAQMTVNVGAVVEWQNEDIFSHTVTADNGSFDSGLIAPGHSWKMKVQHAGTFRYHCRPHPNMTASLTISTGEESPKQNGLQPGKIAETSPPSLRWALPTSPQQIHPILVNFTAALLPLSLLSDLLGRIFRRQSLHNAAWWMVLYAAAITPLTVAAGWWWKHAAGPDLPAKLIRVHQWLGTSAAVILVVLAVWRWSIHKRGVPPSVAYLACTLIAVLALVYQGSVGGTMVFGN